MAWRMPAETEPQARVWMAFPPGDSYLADGQETAARAWAAVAHTIAEFEPVTMVVDPAETEAARRHLGEQKIEIVEAPLDDAWMRDIGPTFVVDESGRLGAVDWVFDGWGKQSWASWGKDERIGAFVAGRAGAKLEASPMVNEGGGIHVDGLGTVLVTETVQLDPQRNPGWTKPDVERNWPARSVPNTSSGCRAVCIATRCAWAPEDTSTSPSRFPRPAFFSCTCRKTRRIRTTPSAARSWTSSATHEMSPANRGRSSKCPRHGSSATTSTGSTTATSTISSSTAA